MPFHLRHDPPGTVPASSLIPEVVIEDDGSLGRATDRAGEEEVDLSLHHVVGGKADGVKEAVRFQALIDLRARKGGIGSEVTANTRPLIPGRDGRKQLAPAIGAVHVAGAQHRPFAVPELVKAKKRVITGATKVAVVGRTFLLPMDGAFRAVHVQDDSLMG